MNITPIVEAIFALIASIITVIIIPYIKIKFDSSKLDQIYSWVVIAVNAAEQIYKESGQGQKKKQYVIDFLMARNIIIDLDMLDRFIESAVYEMKG